MENRCEQANMFFPRRYQTRPQEQKGVFTLLECLYVKKLRAPKPIIFKMLNENVKRDDSVEEIIEDILKEFNVSAPCLNK